MDLIQINQDMATGFTPLTRRDIMDLISSIQERIHTNIEALIGLTSKHPIGDVHPLADLFAQTNQTALLEQVLKPQEDEDPTLETHSLNYMVRINQAIIQIASGLTPVK